MIVLISYCRLLKIQDLFRFLFSCHSLTGSFLIGYLSHPLSISYQICVKGEACTKGYYKDEANTKDLFEPGGFLRTGDIGTWTKVGNLSFTFLRSYCLRSAVLFCHVNAPQICYRDYSTLWHHSIISGIPKFSHFCIVCSLGCKLTGKNRRFLEVSTFGFGIHRCLTLKGMHDGVD